jgi:radical SAM superfamily enzyme YgiQ (UPF0313 family)
VNARADTLTEDIVKLLAESGCKEARIGFETGNEKIRNGLLLKKTSDESLVKAFRILRKYKVFGVAFAMIGIPGESWTTFYDTIMMVSKLKPALIRMTFLFPYKHTKIYDYCVEHQLIKTEEIENNRDFSSPLRFPELTDKELFCFRFLFPWYVNQLWFDSVDYHRALQDFTQLDLATLRNSIPEIIAKDKELSNKCHAPHYRYYKGNEYYFELNDYSKDTIQD